MSKDMTEHENPVFESFSQQYLLDDQEQEIIAQGFMEFCYSVIKAMLAEHASSLPNRTGTLLISVIPMDRETQRSVINGNIVSKSSFGAETIEYPRTKDWDSILLPAIRGLLDPLYGGVLALKAYGASWTPKVGWEQIPDRQISPIDLSRPMILEMVAKLQTTMPWGESPYGEQLPAYKMLLRFLEIFPTMLIRAARDPLSVEGVLGSLQRIEDICYRRMNA